jgi:hypothetical protein
MGLPNFLREAPATNPSSPAQSFLLLTEKKPGLDQGRIVTTLTGNIKSDYQKWSDILRRRRIVQWRLIVSDKSAPADAARIRLVYRD